MVLLLATSRFPYGVSDRFGLSPQLACSGVSSRRPLRPYWSHQPLSEVAPKSNTSRWPHRLHTNARTGKPGTVPQTDPLCVLLAGPDVLHVGAQPAEPAPEP